MNVTVEDTTEPIIGISACDLVVELGYTGQSFSWNVTDPYAGNYTIESDGVGTVVEGTSLGYRELILTISFRTDWKLKERIPILQCNRRYLGMTSPMWSRLTVEPDTTDPVITSNPDDLVVEEGYSGFTLSWTATDLFPGTYSIELAGTGTVVGHTAWISGDAITYNIPNGLSAGTYTYTITFYDDHGNSILDSVVFTVEEPPKPTIPGFGVPVILFITAFYDILP